MGRKAAGLFKTGHYYLGIWLEELRKTLKELSQDSRYPGTDSNQAPREYKSSDLKLSQNAGCDLMPGRAGTSCRINIATHDKIFTDVKIHLLHLQLGQKDLYPETEKNTEVQTETGRTSVYIF
jgi:hypothetical protein